MKIFGNIALAGLLLWLTACAIRIVPDPMQEGQIDVASRLVTKEADGIAVTVQAMAWRFDPYYLDDYFTPLFVLIRNGTEKPLVVTYDAFVLLDDLGNQFNVAPPQTVDRILRGRGMRYPYPGTFYPPPYGPLFPYGSEPYPMHYTDIALLGLAETTVLPHAQVRGFLYFQQATFEGQRLTLSAALGGRPPQEFHFTIER
jgi:hypothetical protein